MKFPAMGRACWLSAVILCFFQTSAQAYWNAFAHKSGDGWIIVSVDMATRGAIGLRCTAGELNAVAMPVPQGAMGQIKVFYEIDGMPFIGMWNIEGDRAVLKGEAAKAFGSQLLTMKGAMWYYVGETPKSLAIPANLHEALAKLPEHCKGEGGI